MRTTTIAVVLAAIALISGCGGADHNEPKPAAAASADAVESSSPSIETATAEQYGSIFSEASNDLPELLETMSDCDWLGERALDTEGSIVCSAGLLTMYYQAATVEATIKGAQKEGVPAYVGPPPAEMQDLVSNTMDAANELKRASNQADKADCAATSAGRCFKLRIETQKAMWVMDDQLAAWGPYM